MIPLDDEITNIVSNEIVVSVLRRLYRDYGSFGSQEDEIQNGYRVGAIEKLICTRLLSFAIALSWFRAPEAANIVDSCLSIQRLARGFLCRCRGRRMRIDREAAMEFVSKQFYAVVIQRYVRGYLWRKRYVGRNQRNQFLREVALVNSVTRQTLIRVESVNRERWLTNESRRCKYNTVERANKQHHLLSTVVTPGVYNSPFFGRASTDWGSPMETIIKDVRNHFT